MTELKLIDREKSGGQSEWIVDRSPFFLGYDKDGDELWLSRRPYTINERIHKFAAGYTPTLEDIDRVLSEAGF